VTMGSADGRLPIFRDTWIQAIRHPIRFSEASINRTLTLHRNFAVEIPSLYQSRMETPASWSIISSSASDFPQHFGGYYFRYYFHTNHLKHQHLCPLLKGSQAPAGDEFGYFGSSSVNKATRLDILVRFSEELPPEIPVRCNKGQGCTGVNASLIRTRIIIIMHTSVGIGKEFSRLKHHNKGR